MKQETKERLKEYSIHYGKKITAGLVMGGLIGLGLSYLPLSPLLMVAIIAAVPVILFTLYRHYEDSKAFNKTEQEFGPSADPATVKAINDLLIKESFKGLFKSLLAACIIAGAGVGLAAGICALIPGVMLLMGPVAAILAGAAIGVIAVVAKDPIQERIASPMVERVSKRFSSKEVEGPSI